MAKNKISKRTKALALVTVFGACATIVNFVKDKNNSIKIRNELITEQDNYICELEQFIMDNITGYEFSNMPGTIN